MRCLRILALLMALLPHLLIAADHSVAWRAYEKGDYAHALPAYRAAAQKGRPLAQYNYAMMLWRGEGTPVQADEAIVWLRKAADGHLAQAQYALGLLYENGDHLPRSQPDATHWFLLAAEGGHVGAQYIVATMYEKGEGQPKDLAEAWRWYSAAALQGDPAAAIRARDLGQRLRGVGSTASPAH